jgi:hypothetical protein
MVGAALGATTPAPAPQPPVLPLGRLYDILIDG